MTDPEPPSHKLVQKLWNYCNILRDDGLSYSDYMQQLTFGSVAPAPSGFAALEQFAAIVEDLK